MIHYIRTIILDFIAKYIKSPTQEDVLHPLGMYGVVTGAYCGEIWIFIECNEDEYTFLSIPKNINRSAKAKDIKYAISNGIIEFIQCVDVEVFKLLKEQFKYNESHKPK